MRQTMLARTVFALVAGAFLSVAMAADTPAPDAGGGAAGGRRQRGQGGPGGQFDPAARETALKTALGVTDDEYAALKPKMDAVQKLRNEARQAQFAAMGFGGGRGFGNRGGNNNPDATPPEKTELQKKTDALKGLLDNKESDPKAVQEALAGLRAERDKNKEALKKAQAELKELLTAKQEAYLVMRGDLD